MLLGQFWSVSELFCSNEMKSHSLAMLLTFLLSNTSSFGFLAFEDAFPSSPNGIPDGRDLEKSEKKNFVNIAPIELKIELNKESRDPFLGLKKFYILYKCMYYCWGGGGGPPKIFEFPLHIQTRPSYGWGHQSLRI